MQFDCLVWNVANAGLSRPVRLCVVIDQLQSEQTSE